MVNKYLIATFFMVSSLVAMEKELESYVFSIRTSDEEIIKVPSFFLGYSKTLKDMCDDVAGTAKDQVCPMPVGSTPFNKVIELANIHFSNPGNWDQAVRIAFKEIDVLLLTRIFSTVNYLDCAQLFPAILLALCHKIHQVLCNEQKLELIDEVLDNLPQELQKQIQEILLKHGYIRDFITVNEFADETQNSVEKDMPYDVRAGGKYLQVSGFNQNKFGFYLYEIRNNPMRKLGFYSNGVHNFSKSGKYMFQFKFLDRTRSDVTLYNLETGKQLRFSASYDFKTAQCKISEDECFLFINQRAFDVETGEEVHSISVPSQHPPEVFSKPIKRDNYDHPKLKEKGHEDIFRKQLPDELLGSFSQLVTITDDAHHAFILKLISLNNNKKSLFVYDISNIHAIQKKDEFINVTEYSMNNSLILLRAVVNDSPRLYSIDLTSYKILKNVPAQEIKLGSAGNSYLELGSDAKKITYYSFIESIKKFGEFDIPNNYIQGSVNTIGYVGSNDTILTRVKKNQVQVIEIRNLPFDFLMRNCTLKQLLILVMCKNKPSLLENPFCQECLSTVDEQVLSLAHLEKTTEDEKKRKADNENTNDRPLKRPRTEE